MARLILNPNPTLSLRPAADFFSSKSCGSNFNPLLSSSPNPNPNADVTSFCNLNGIPFHKLNSASSLTSQIPFVNHFMTLKCQTKNRYKTIFFFFQKSQNLNNFFFVTKATLNNVIFSSDENFVSSKREMEKEETFVTAFSDSLPFSSEVAEAVRALQAEFSAVDLLVAQNLNRVLMAYSQARVGIHHFSGSTGYGHNDSGGREALDFAFAKIFECESAVVRSQFFSGTHAIACALYAVLRPGDELLAIAGAPYDTLEEVIGGRGREGDGSLREFGVSYREVPLAEDGGLNWEVLATTVTSRSRCALIQRSCGYNSKRKTLTISDIERAIKIIKSQNSNCVIVVDNCYGEFVETREPSAVGAELVAGSLIKNPGGMVAPAGGYVAGQQRWVEAAAARLAAPGIGTNSGATSGETMRLFLQGLFLAPQIVGEALKGSLLVAEVMGRRGYRVQPPPRVRRYDIIQAVELGSREKLLSFCEAVQKKCPVGSYVRPVAGVTAGYESEVVFADGTFIDGSTIELSCDGPLREPFAVFCQGGSSWTHWALALDVAIATL